MVLFLKKIHDGNQNKGAKKKIIGKLRHEYY
jgi:hypothetical protein